MLDRHKSAILLFINNLKEMDNKGQLTQEMRDESLKVLQDAVSKHLKIEIPTGVKLAWELSGGDVDRFRKLLQSLPDKELNDLEKDEEKLQYIINNLNQTSDRDFKDDIFEIDQDGDFPIQQARDQLGFVGEQQFPSSNIYDFAYQPTKKRLIVKFQGNKGLGEGPIYEYNGVPAMTYKLFRDGAISAKTTGENKWGRWWKHKNPSLGASHFALLKDKFKFKRLS